MSHDSFFEAMKERGVVFADRSVSLGSPVSSVNYDDILRELLATGHTVTVVNQPSGSGSSQQDIVRSIQASLHLRIAMYMNQKKAVASEFAAKAAELSNNRC